MSFSFQPSPSVLQRSNLADSRTRSVDASHHDELETFLRERLENWDKEAAKAIVVWGRLGGMCSSEYLSQLRRAQTTLSKSSKAKQCNTLALQVYNDSHTHRRQSYRDRLAAQYWARKEEKMKAAQQHRDRELRRQKRPQANVQAPLSLPPMSQPTPSALSRQLRTLRAASTSLSPRLTSARAPHVPFTPALPTGHPRRTRRSSVGGPAHHGESRVHEVKLEARNTKESQKHKELAAPINECSNFTLSGARSDGRSSLIFSTKDGQEASATASTPTAMTSQPSSSFHDTFIMRRRRRLSEHGRLSSSSVVALKHTAQHDRSLKNSPRAVAPSRLQPTSHTACGRSPTSSNTTRQDCADEEGKAPLPVSTIGLLLPSHSDVVTATFTFSSPSPKKPSGLCRRRSTQGRRLNISEHTERQDYELDADAQKSTANSLLQAISPIKKISNSDDLSSASSAASYLNRGVLEE
ncbi:hypothetical protein, unknown function [Leishmania tarentolae]|uniref:Uncharacterized protein n=1 Tax=Leishmania tarentolae TaxID=5689 RepID=A0A640KVS0_LEITA|nr:hypothetical protein, unknown function [Leishmania tarentolae]